MLARFVSLAVFAGSLAVLLAPRAMASAGAKLSSTPAEEPPPACPSGMIEVEGEYCPQAEQVCTANGRAPSTPRWTAAPSSAPTGRCLGTPVPKHFCIDKYEWPQPTGGRSRTSR